jgi:hypothetical protein
MGYTTDFSGAFDVTPPLTASHAAYLNKFSETRRMKRIGSEEGIGNRLADPDFQGEEGDIRKVVDLPWGVDGEFFVGGLGFAGQDRDKTVIDSNVPPRTQPGLWCQWVPSADGSHIEWNGAEKFYDYVAWLQYIIDNFLKRWGYTLNGEVEWQGEDSSDFGKIVVSNNVIKIKKGRRTYEDEEGA